MKFEKKLIILTGEGFAKGAVSLERNALGVNVSFNSYNLKDLKLGNYFLVIKYDFQVVTKLLGKNGNISIKFSMSDVDFNKLHCLVVQQDSSSVNVVLYGTLNPVKLWQGNMLDGVKISPLYDKSIINDKIYSSIVEENTPKLDNETMPNIDSINYDDEALATTNFYPSNLFNEINKIIDDHDNIINNTALENTPQYVNATESENFPSHEKLSHIKQEYLRHLSTDTAKLAKYKNIRKNAPTNNSTSEIPSNNSTKTNNNNLHFRKITFYEQIQPALKALFSNNESIPQLNKNLPDSKWVKVMYDNSRYYIVGLIGDNYIAYGVPSTYSTSPPKEFEGYACWLPLNPANPTGNGFWIIYQDAKTGASIPSAR